MIPDDVIPNPSRFWIKNLRRGNRVFLLKEKRYAQISHAYDGSHIGILVEYEYNEYVKWEDRKSGSWDIYVDGTGLDGILLMLPVKNCYTDHPESIDQPEVNKLKIRVDMLEEKFKIMHNMISIYEDLLKIEMEKRTNE